VSSYGFGYGFGPLEDDGITFDAEAFQVFSRWTEILSTDQVAPRSMT